MSRFFVGQRVRVVGVFHPELEELAAALGMEGRVNQVGCNANHVDATVGVTLGVPCPLLRRMDGWVFAPYQLEPILPDGHRPAELSVDELLPFLASVPA